MSATSWSVNMKIISSIKHQTLALLVGLTTGLTLLYLASTVVIAFIVEDELINNLLKTQASYNENQYQKTGQLPLSNLQFIKTYEDASLLPAWAKDSILNVTQDNEIFTNDEKHYHYIPLRLTEDKTGYLLAEVSDLLVVTNHPKIFQIFLISLFITLGLAVYLSLKFSTRIVKPVILLADTVKSKQLLGEDKPFPQLEYELGYLSNALEETFKELTLMFEREKAFTTDVGHELRTPLTVFNNALTLIEQRGFKDNDLAQLNKVSKQMDNTVSVLLALARSESLEKEPCNVKMILEQIILSNLSATQDSLQVKLEISEGFQVNANPTLFHLMLRNLLDNAREHASSKALIIREQNNSLIFENAAQELLPNDIILQGNKSKASHGVGQGLYLVTRIVECFDWQYQLQQVNNTFSFAITPKI